jgi:hypothetical protein
MDAACSVKPPSAYTGCRCPQSQVCVTRPQAGGVGFIGCVDIPAACAGTATCECMGCVCAELGLRCAGLKLDTSTGSGTDLDCR